jgi:hypothetical protein
MPELGRVISRSYAPEMAESLAAADGPPAEPGSRHASREPACTRTLNFWAAVLQTAHETGLTGGLALREEPSE